MITPLMEQIAYIITTVSNARDADFITRSLIEQNLAACVQLSERTSHYRWQGQLEQQQEYVLHIKTSVPASRQTLEWLSTNHPYELPEILLLPTQASSDYARWINELCVQQN